MSDVLTLARPSDPKPEAASDVAPASPAAESGTDARKKRRRKTRPQDMARVLKDLANQLEAGVPERDALQKLGERSSSEVIAKSYLAAAKAMDAGDSIADALGAQTAIIPPVARELIKAGVTPATLHANLRRAAENIIKSADVRGTLNKQLRKPIGLLALTIATFWGIISFAFPDTTTMGSQTELIIQIMRAIANTLVVATIAALVIGLAVRAWWKTSGSKNPTYQLKLDRLQFRIPTVRDILRLDAASKLSAVLAAALDAGLPETEALRIAGEASGSPAVAHHVSAHLDRMEKDGAPLVEVLDSEYLPWTLADRVAGQLTPAKRAEVLFACADDFQTQAFEEMADFGKKIADRVETTSLALLGAMMVAVIVPQVMAIMFQVQQINV